MAALRFMTGVQTELRRRRRAAQAARTARSSAIAQYLEAARILRPDVNMARAGIVARRALVDYNRAKLFPDIGLGAGRRLRLDAERASSRTTSGRTTRSTTSTTTSALGLQLEPRPPAAGGAHPAGRVAARGDARARAARARQRELEVEKAYADAVEAKAREEAWDRAEHIAKQWISIVQDHIDLGTWDERALLEPLRAYGNARVAAPLRADGLQRRDEQPRARERLGQRGAERVVSRA